MAPLEDDIGFMGPILGRAKKVLFPDNYPIDEHAATGSKKKNTKSRARRARHLEFAGGSSLANMTNDNNSGTDGKENDDLQLSLTLSKNKKRVSAHRRKMDSLAVAATTDRVAAKGDMRKEHRHQKLSAGGRRSGESRSSLEIQCGSTSVSSEQQLQVHNGNIRKSTGGRNSNDTQSCSLLVACDPDLKSRHYERRRSRVHIKSALVRESSREDLMKEDNTSKQKQNRRRARFNHPISSLVRKESGSCSSKLNSSRGSSHGGKPSRTFSGASSLMSLPSSTQKGTKLPKKQIKKKKKNAELKGDDLLNVSSLTNEVGRLSLDNGQLGLSSFRSPLTLRHRSRRPSGEITSPEGILRYSTMNSNIFRNDVMMGCSPVPGLNPRKRVDKKKTPPKIMGLTVSQSPSDLQTLSDQSRSSPQEIVESKSPSDRIPTEMEVEMENGSESSSGSQVVDANTEEESFVGRRIARTFDNKVYHGTVTRFLKTHRLWKILYEDGDKEEMDFEELSYAIDFYDGKITESDCTETNRPVVEGHKPGSAVIDVEVAPVVAKITKVKKSYSKLPKKQVKVTQANEENGTPTKTDTEPTRRSTRVVKKTDRLTVANWKRRVCSKAETVSHVVEEMDKSSVPDLNNITKKDDSETIKPAVIDDGPITQNGTWSNSEVVSLRDAIKKMDPTSATYWEDVSSAVRTKSPFECRQKWFSLVATPRVKRVPSKKDEKIKMDSIDCKLTETDLSDIEGECDDLFDATPFRSDSTKDQDEMGIKRTTFDSEFSFGMSPCVRQLTTLNSGMNGVSSVKNRRKGYNTYIENLRRELHPKIQRRKENNKINVKKKKASDSGVYVQESAQIGSGQLLPDGKLNITIQEDSFREEEIEIDDMWDVNSNGDY